MLVKNASFPAPIRFTIKRQNPSFSLAGTRFADGLPRRPSRRPSKPVILVAIPVAPELAPETPNNSPASSIDNEARFPAAQYVHKLASYGPVAIVPEFSTLYRGPSNRTTRVLPNSTTSRAYDIVQSKGRAGSPCRHGRMTLSRVGSFRSFDQPVGTTEDQW